MKNIKKLNNLLNQANSPQKILINETQPKKNKNKLYQEKEKVLNTLADRKNTISTFCFK